MSGSEWNPIDREQAERLLLSEGSSNEEKLKDMIERLPPDVKWYFTRLTPLLFSRLRHIYDESWDRLSSGTGLLAKSSSRVINVLENEEDSDQADHIRAIVNSFDESLIGRLLIGTNNLPADPALIIDGNHRCTALSILNMLNEGFQLPAVEVVAAKSEKPIWNWNKKRI